MRALVDTLPILRDEDFGAAQSETEDARPFHPDLIKRALRVRQIDTVSTETMPAEVVDVREISSTVVTGVDVDADTSDQAGDAAPSSHGSVPAKGSTTVQAVRHRLREISTTSAHAYDGRLTLGGHRTEPEPPADGAQAHDAEAVAAYSMEKAARRASPHQVLRAAIPHHSALSPSPAEVEEPAPDRVKEAVDQALAEAAEKHDAEIAAVRTEAEATATARVVEARAEWVREEGQRLAAALDAQMAELKIVLSDAIADVLKPFVTAAMNERAVERFAGLLSQLSADSATPFLTVSGPQDLLDMLAETLKGVTTVSFQPSDSTDLSVQIGDTELRTTLAQWIANIELTEIAT